MDTSDTTYTMVGALVLLIAVAHQRLHYLGFRAGREPKLTCFASDTWFGCPEGRPRDLSLTELFTPFGLNGLTLANRIVMAPMTRNFSPGGVPGPDVAAYYRRRAEGGAGLILTEGTAPNHPEAKNMPDVPHIYGEEALAGWARVVEGVHAAGGRIFSQIWHVGAVQGHTEPKLPRAPISPSGLLKPDTKIGEPMTNPKSKP